MNEEESRAFGCFRHKPPVPIVSLTVTFPRHRASDDVMLQIGQVLCAECKQQPLIKEIVTDRRPKKKANIWTPPSH